MRPALGRYLNQVVVLERRVSDTPNTRGEFDYEAPRQIAARNEPKSREITTARGALLSAVAEIYTIVEVRVGDKLNDRVVLIVEKYVWADGSTVGYVSWI